MKGKSGEKSYIAPNYWLPPHLVKKVISLDGCWAWLCDLFKSMKPEWNQAQKIDVASHGSTTGPFSLAQKFMSWIGASPSFGVLK